jgi:predicted ATPase/class 3 adenylate cyclase
MSVLPGYELKGSLLEDESTVLLMGVDVQEQRPVWVKMLRSEHPTPHAVALFRRDFDVAHSLGTEAVLAPRELVRAGGRLALVYEDFAGQALQTLLTQGRLDVATALEIAIRAAELLHLIHRREIIHKNLSPASLLVGPAGQFAKLLDFRFCTQLSREIPQRGSAVSIEGRLPYVSPEQTGRMNRSVDFRSDLYSLGVTLYEMLTGRVPFESDDPLELVHCHIARKPEPPSEVNPDVPHSVSELVMKLLAKRAEDRYQSAAGVRADLETALQLWRTTGNYGSFELGRADGSGRLEVPEKLYGRESQVAELSAAFDRVASGPAEFVLVAGYSGVGKSALVHELHKPAARQRGNFIFGKFDQFQRDMPYRALTQALSQAVDQILADTNAEVAQWRSRLQAVLGEYGQLLVELIPGLEHVVGPQPPVQALPPLETQSRFNRLLHQFVLAFASPGRPLVLFLDDLQWADSATLGLIQQIATDPYSRHLLLIGAYRDNEVDEHHPLALALAQARNAGAKLRRLVLQPLGVEDVQDLVAETLKESRETVRRLSELLHAKTGGNPFHLNQFLESLQERGLLRLGEDRRWHWDVQRIESEDITSNVVDLMIQRIRALPAGTQRVLELASCIGNRFALHTLAIVCEEDAEQTGQLLWEAVREGLVLPLGNAYKFLGRPGSAPDGPVPALSAAGLGVEYRFLHDRVQQAAYALIAPGAQRAVHLRIGRLLRGECGQTPREEQLFDVVNHLNAAIDLIADPRERIDLARLDLAAGRKALASSAYGPAAVFLDAGIGLLPPDAWDLHYELALGLHDASAEAEYMANRPERGHERGGVLLARARKPLEKVKVYELRIQHAIAEARLPEALDIALDALALLGVRLPRHPGKSSVLLPFFAMKARLALKSLDDLRALPEMTEPEPLAAIGLLLRVSPAAYQSSPELLALIICKEMDLILRHGNSLHSAQAYASWAVLLCELLGDVKGTYAYGRLAVDVAHKYPHRDVHSRATFYFGTFSQHWAEPQRDSDALLTSHQSGSLEGGDLQFFGYLVYIPIFLNFFAGGEIGPLLERFEAARRTFRSNGLDNMFIIASLGLQSMENLAGGSARPDLLLGRHFDATVELPRLAKQENRTACFFGRLMATVLAYHFGQYERAVEEAEAATGLLDAIMSTVFVVETRFYRALAAAAYARGRGTSARNAARRPMLENLRRLRKWSRANPANFAHKADLVEAEWLSLSGSNQRAEAAYDRAAAGARAQGFVNEEALARERAGLHFLELGRTAVAATCLREALAGYTAWGATAKVAALRAAHPLLLPPESAAPAASSAEGLDVQSVLKASRVISSEILLEKLLEKLLQIAVQTAGAERGVLVRVSDNGPVVEADGGAEHVELVAREPVAAGDRASPAIVNYALRTREPVVLEDACAEKTFAGDPYIADKRPRSVLAVPILGQGEVKSVLYLENNLTTGAFTPDRVEVLRMLSIQAAVSLENAQLYSDLSRLNQAYERFVPRALLRFLDKKSIVDVSLGDHVEREVSVLFSDIRSFTSISERMRPAESFNFINAYLGRMEPLVERHGGFIDKYLGDAIMALFDRRAADPVLAAADMLRELAELNASRALNGEEPIEIGIGINTGAAMMGTIGGHRRMDGTVIGDTVNLAERLEKLTKFYRAAVLVSGHTVAALGEKHGIEFRWLGRDSVKGRSEGVELYELLDGLPSAILERRLASREGLTEALRSLYAGDRPGALARLTSVLAADPGDPTVRAILERLRAGTIATEDPA